MPSNSIYNSFTHILESTEYNSLYLKRYCKFILSILESRPNIKRKHTENHHILPKCMDGTDSSNNLIYLTYREHFLAHYMLAKSFPHHTIVYAITKMNRDNTINSRLFEIGKRLHAGVVLPKKKCITNEKDIKYILETDDIPDGWRLGAVKRVHHIIKDT